MTDTPQPDPAPDANELQERLAKAEEELERIKAEGAARSAGRGGRIGRSIGAFTLVTLGVIVAVVAVLAVWVKDVALDTNEFVSIVAPLAEDPEVTDGVAALAVDKLFVETDAEQRATKALDEILPADAQFLTGAIVAGLRNVTTQAVERVLASPEFAQIWEQANRLAHQQAVAILLDEQSGAISAQDGNVSLDLSGVLTAAQAQLQDLGAGGILSRVTIPQGALTIEIAKSDELERAQVAAQLLDEAGTWLPWFAIALLAAGVLVANNRRRTIVSAMVALVVSLLLMAVLFRIARTVVLGSLEPGFQSALGRDLWYATVAPLRSMVLWILLIALVVILVTWLSGPSPAAVGIRRGAVRGYSFARDRGTRVADERRGTLPQLSPYKRPIEIATAALALLVLLIVPGAGIVAVLIAAIVVIAIIGAVELLVPSLPRGGEPPEPPRSTPTVGGRELPY